MSAETPRIRSYAARDRAEVYDICVRTGRAGDDASGLYSHDDLLPDVYAGPYLALEPDLAFVVETRGRVCGYILGAQDTRLFVRRYRELWLPHFRGRYPDVSEPVTAEDQLVHRGSRPELMLIPEVDQYPAHLHIDLLPEAQGRGLGRELLRTLLQSLADRGVPALHLSMDAANTNARGFYRRIGFEELGSHTPEEPVLGIGTAALP